MYLCFYLNFFSKCCRIQVNAHIYLESHVSLTEKMSRFLSQPWALSIVTVCVYYPHGQFSADNRTLPKHLMRFIPISRTQRKGRLYPVTTLRAFGLYWILFTQERSICDEGPTGPFHQIASGDGQKAIWWSLCPWRFAPGLSWWLRW